MSLYNYQVFMSVVQNGSFARAAEELNITPSAVSHIIAKLEKEFDIRLFRRGRTGVMITDAGTKILPYILTIQQHNEMLLQEIDQIHGFSSGTVCIGIFNSVTVQWMPDIMKSFRARYPDIEILLFQGGYNEILSWIESKTVDLAFVTDAITPRNEYIPLYKDMIVCVTPKNYALQNADYVTIEDIKHMPMILQADGYDTEARNLLKKYNLPNSSPFNVNSDESLIAMVEAGFGCCIMPNLAAASTKSDVKILPIMPREYRTIGLITVSPNAVAPATKKMRQQILSYIEDHNLMNI